MNLNASQSRACGRALTALVLSYRGSRRAGGGLPGFGVALRPLRYGGSELAQTARIATAEARLRVSTAATTPMMRKRRTICGGLLGLAGGALLGMALLLHDHALADVLGGPLPAPRLPRDLVQLTPVEKLGKLMLYDNTLSNPQATPAPPATSRRQVLRAPIRKSTPSQVRSRG